jgi:hypothetical protein
VVWCSLYCFKVLWMVWRVVENSSVNSATRAPASNFAQIRSRWSEVNREGGIIFLEASERAARRGGIVKYGVEKVGVVLMEGRQELV